MILGASWVQYLVVVVEVVHWSLVVHIQLVMELHYNADPLEHQVVQDMVAGTVVVGKDPYLIIWWAKGKENKI